MFFINLACQDSGEHVSPKKTPSAQNVSTAGISLYTLRTERSQLSFQSLTDLMRDDGYDALEIFTEALKDEGFARIFPGLKADQAGGRTNTACLSPTCGPVEIDIRYAYSYLAFTPLADQYFLRLLDQIPEYESTSNTVDFAAFVDGVHAVQIDIYNDASLTPNNKEILLLMCNVMQENFENILIYINADTQLMSGGRTNGWLKKAWRKVRSVLVTTVVMAGAGFAAGGPIVAIVTGAVGLITSIIDIAANNRCWFAMQCDGGWAQDCNTGACMPRDNPAPPYIPSTNPNPQPDPDDSDYYQEWQVIDCDGGRAKDETCVLIGSGTLTFAKMDELGRLHGVYQDIQNRYSYLSSGQRWVIYKFQLAAILEDAALRSMGIQKNRKAKYDATGRYSIPDGIAGSGFAEEKTGSNGQKYRQYYAWREGTIIEVKLSQLDELPFAPTYNPYQVSKMIGFLKTLTEARTNTQSVPSADKNGVLVPKNATAHSAAILHFITLAGVALSPDFEAEFTANRIHGLHSVCDHSEGGNWTIETMVVRNPKIISSPTPENVGRVWNRPAGMPVTFNWSIRKFAIDTP
jgi:hypothetical protein